MLSEDRQDVVMNALCHEAQMQTGHFHAVITEPFTRLRPSIYIDGDQWCALYGENLQDGVAGFGSSPAEAEIAFNAAWFEALKPRTAANVIGAIRSDLREITA